MNIEVADPRARDKPSGPCFVHKTRRLCTTGTAG